MARQGEAVRSVRGRVADGCRQLRGDAAMTSYVSATDNDSSEMLAEIGVGSLEELFADIPASLRLARPLALERGLSEQEVYEELRSLAARNVSTEQELSF